MRNRPGTAQRPGSAAGVAAALFPPVGILGALAVGGGAGAAIGAVAGHAAGGMSRSDLKELGETLDAGTAGLIVVYETNLADQVKANIKAANRIISKATDMEADQLAADMKKAAACRSPARQRETAAEQAGRRRRAAATGSRGGRSRVGPASLHLSGWGWRRCITSRGPPTA